MAHSVDFFVEVGFFFDVGVGSWYVCFWLVVVVVRYEVLDRVIGEEFFEFGAELCC